MIEKRTGKVFYNKEGYSYKVIASKSYIDTTVEFEDGTIINNIPYGRIKRGAVSFPYNRSVFGIGYMGEGKYKSSINNIQTKVHTAWKHMIARCYHKRNDGTFKAYENCSVDERWHNFQVFAQWYEENANLEVRQGWQVDKDILIKGNKVYSPETCAFVPPEINMLFVKKKAARGIYPIGVTKSNSRFMATCHVNGTQIYLGTYDTPEEAFEAYKIAKEAWIKRVADKWKALISERCYQAMYNYKVDITD